jgi:uroporphyrinogen-III synthase
MIVFITRELAHNAPFKNLLEQRGWQVRGQSLVIFKPVPFEVIPEGRWIFFSSSTAVHFFFTHYGTRAKTRYYWAAIGPDTAKTIISYTGHCDFCGTGDPFTTATEFCAVVRGQTLVLIRPRISAQSIQSILHAHQIPFSELVVYDNQPLPHPPAQHDANVLVFTSALNAEAYFTAHSLQSQQKTVAIGRSTLARLHQLGIRDTILSPQPDVYHLAQCVLETAKIYTTSTTADR